MLITHEREKLINAIIYFARNTENCGITKLMKLLFLLDFEHFKLTGRSVTGQGYYAFPKGPVPGEIHSELSNDFGDDLANALSVKAERVGNYTRYTVIPKLNFDASLFSKRELRILELTADQFRRQTATEMVDVTHAENGVWDRVYADGEGKFLHIPYELALPEADMPELILEKSKEFSAIRAHFESCETRPH